MKKRKWMLALTLLVSLILCSCGIFNSGKPSLAKIDYRTDVQPIMDRFPMLQEIEQVYWKADTFGHIYFGPTSYYMSGFAVLSDSAKEELENQYSFSEQAEPVLPEGIDCSITGFSAFEWYTDQDFTHDMLRAAFVGTIYYDRMNGVVFLDVENM